MIAESPTGPAPGEGNSDVLGLRAVDPVTEDPSPTPETLSVLAGPTESAGAAGRDAGDEDPVADAAPSHGGTDLFDRPDGLVPEDASTVDGRDVTLENVQVGAADRHRVDAHHGVVRLEDGGLRHVVP
jgi:hypothetical protein